MKRKLFMTVAAVAAASLLGACNQQEQAAEDKVDDQIGVTLNGCGLDQAPPLVKRDESGDFTVDATLDGTPRTITFVATPLKRMKAFDLRYKADGTSVQAVPPYPRLMLSIDTPQVPYPAGFEHIRVLQFCQDSNPGFLNVLISDVDDGFLTGDDVYTLTFPYFGSAAQ